MVKYSEHGRTLTKEEFSEKWDEHFKKLESDRLKPKPVLTCSTEEACQLKEQFLNKKLTLKERFEDLVLSNKILTFLFHKHSWKKRWPTPVDEGKKWWMKCCKCGKCKYTNVKYDSWGHIIN